MTTAMSPMITASASLMYELVRVTVSVMKMHTTSDIIAYTAGSVAVGGFKD
jgi:hypothetical protein